VSRVLLTRHAQASFLEANYDKLSPVGEAQARQLGEYWARRVLIFQRVCSGPRIRQKETARIVGEVYHTFGVSFPEPLVMQEFDEYQGEAVIEKSLPDLLKKDGKIQKLYDTFRSSPGPRERHRNFQKLFEVVICQWVKGDLSVPGVETWPEFCSRVNRGISRFISQAGHGEQAVIFTSGGPIAVAMQRALHLSQQDTLGVTWMSHNCSYSEFIFSRERFTLSSFNASPHLEDPSMLTYR
jgi:broad specificity phosphatase PhoE